MKHNILGLLLVAFSIISCEERNPGHFIDLSGVYFNNTTGMMTVTDSTDLTFVYEAGDELQVPVKVQLVGRPAEYDRPLEIRMSSENAQEGTDYTLPAQAVLPAGASSVDYVVTLKRTPALKREKKMLHLTIHPNDHFDLPVTHIVQVGDSVSVLDYRIYFSDMFTSAPAAWDTNLLGEFTQQKFELICKVLEIDPGEFNDPSLMTLAKQLYISSEMTAYVRGELAKKNAGRPYDTDAFDPQSGEPLSFTK